MTTIHLESILSYFERLNSVLLGNWNDKVSAGFANGTLSPLSQSMKQYIGNINALDQEVDVLIRQLDSEMVGFDRAAIRYQQSDSPHKGWPIMMVSGEKCKGFNGLYYFIISPTQFSYVCNNDKVSKRIAMQKHPDLLSIEEVAFSGNTVK